MWGMQAVGQLLGTTIQSSLWLVMVMITSISLIWSLQKLKHLLSFIMDPPTHSDWILRSLTLLVD